MPLWSAPNLFNRKFCDNATEHAYNLGREQMETGHFHTGHSDSNGFGFIYLQIRAFLVRTGNYRRTRRKYLSGHHTVYGYDRCTADCAGRQYLSGSPHANSKLHIELAETPFFAHSVSEFILPESGKEYLVFPDVIWNYQALLENTQAMPVTVSIQAKVNNNRTYSAVHTYSVRSINECLLGYIDSKMKFHDTGDFFAAYVNEDNPNISQVLREALDSRIVNRFWGYQSKDPKVVDKQVYALWYVLQKRGFKYSSISNSSLSSNVVFTQRVRTFDDALQSAQINCVDGSVLFASLLKAININPILVRVPGHMFVGYYTDRLHQEIHFLETSMIGDVNLDDFFPEEKLDSTMAGKSQESVSKFMFEKSKEYATRIYNEHKDLIHSGKVNYMFLEIDKATRAYVQPIAAK